MITTYLDEALRRARYGQVDGGVFCATVPGLQVVIATAATLVHRRRDALKHSTVVH